MRRFPFLNLTTSPQLPSQHALYVGASNLRSCHIGTETTAVKCFLLVSCHVW